MSSTLPRLISAAERVAQHPWVVRVERVLFGHDGRGMAAILITLGILLRLLSYLDNRSLWLDEAWLALNIVQKSFAELRGLLDFSQMAPVGFLYIEKLMVLEFGNNEYALRAFPFVAGILSLFLFYAVARRVLSLRGYLIALGLFAIASPLLRYSSELKQYSSDVAIALMIYWLGLRCFNPKHNFIGSLVLLSVVGAVLIWFSHPAIFSLAGAGIALTIYCLKTQRWSHILWLAIPACLLLGSFAFNYVISLDLSQSAKMIKAWSGGTAFLPGLPTSIWELFGYQDAFFSMFRNPGGLEFPGLAALCFLVGVGTVFFEKRHIWYLLTLPFLFTIIASVLQKYPFHGRLLLFLVPAILLFVGEGLDRIVSWTKSYEKVMLAVLGGLLFLVPAEGAVFTILDPSRLSNEEMKPVLQHLREHYQEGDTLYVYHSSEPAFLYYAERYGFKDVGYHRGVPNKHNWNTYVEDLQSLRGKDRVWVVFSHVLKKSGMDEEIFFLHILNNMGTQLDAYKSRGASVYLYALPAPSASTKAEDHLVEH